MLVLIGARDFSIGFVLRKSVSNFNTHTNSKNLLKSSTLTMILPLVGQYGANCTCTCTIVLALQGNYRGTTLTKLP